jgi:hypothetical protein
VEIFTTAIDSSDVRKLWAAGCSGKRRVQWLAPSVVELRSASGEGEVCSSLYNLSDASRTYDWTIQPLGPGAGCASAVPISFAPAGGTVSIGPGQRTTLSATAWVAGAAMTSPFAVCYRVQAVDQSEGGSIAATGTLTYSGQPVNGHGHCTPPELGLVTGPSPFESAGGERLIVGAQGVAHFTVHNDGASPRTLDYRVSARDAENGSPSVLVGLDGQTPGVEVAGSVVIAAYGSADVPVSVSVQGDEPLVADELLLAADRDGDLSFEELATTRVSVAPDTSLALVGAGGGATSPAQGVALRAAPNPFTRGTTLFVRVPRATHARVSIHDASGRRVRGLEPFFAVAGETRVAWDGRDDGGAVLRAGVYFARVATEGVTVATRLVLLAP